MHSIPDDFDYSMFKDKRLDTVTFAEFVVYLQFDDGPLVSIESSYAYKTAPSEPEHNEEAPISLSSLTRLVGQIVRSAETTDESDMVLYFDEGRYIKINHDYHYEAYRIEFHGQDIIV